MASTFGGPLPPENHIHAKDDKNNSNIGERNMKATYANMLKP